MCLQSGPEQPKPPPEEQPAVAGNPTPPAAACPTLALGPMPSPSRSSNVNPAPSRQTTNTVSGVRHQTVCCKIASQQSMLATRTQPQPGQHGRSPLASRRVGCWPTGPPTCHAAARCALRHHAVHQGQRSIHLIQAELAPDEAGQALILLHRVKQASGRGQVVGGCSVLVNSAGGYFACGLHSSLHLKHLHAGNTWVSPAAPT